MIRQYDFFVYIDCDKNTDLKKILRRKPNKKVEKKLITISVHSKLTYDEL